VPDVMVFPDTRQCLTDLIDGTTHDGRSVTVQWMLVPTAHGSLDGPLPVVHIQLTQGGTEGYLDRADRLTVAAYMTVPSGPNDPSAMSVLESVRASVIGHGIETPSGYLDSVRVINAPAPTESAFNSDSIDRAVMTLEVVTRPV